MPKQDLEEEFPGNPKSASVAPVRRRKASQIKVQEEVVETKKPLAHGIRKKRSFTESVARTFLGEETKSVGKYILFDVLIPAAKNTIQEMISQGLEMLLFGETRGTSRSRGRDKDRTTISYNSIYRNRDRDENPYDPRSKSSRSRGRFDLDDIVFRHGDEAAEVLDGLCDMLEQYDQVTVADFYELAGVDGGSWTDQKWGWTNLSKAFCTHTRGGYTVVLPEPVALD